MTSKLTKIVATIGPASDSESTIRELINSGVNVFRFNMKHADVAWHSERIPKVQKIAEDMGTVVGILIDLQGPEIRIETTDKQDITVESGNTVKFAKEFIAGETIIRIEQKEVFESLKTGDNFSIDDGFMDFTITESGEDYFIARSADNYTIKNRKGLNLSGQPINLPSLIDDDYRKLDMATIVKVDFIALSFCRTRKDIEILREEMAKRNINAKIVAKIESQEALDNLKDIIDATDVVMVARGDLGIEVPIEQLAYWQTTLVTECRRMRKPVIVATQMLQSMVDSPRPTRAEATDVANAIYDGTDAVMLSGETASGKYPIKAVQAMTKIAQFNETKNKIIHIDSDIDDSTEMITEGIWAILEKYKEIEAIVVFTETGRTARAISSMRPYQPIYALSARKETVEQLSVSYGVEGYFMDVNIGSRVSNNEMINILIENNKLKQGQLILIAYGQQLRIPGLTNSVTVMQVE